MDLSECHNQSRKIRLRSRRNQKSLMAGRILIGKLEIGEEKERLTLKEIDLKNAVDVMTKNLMMDVLMVKGVQKEKGIILIMEFSSVRGCLGREVALKLEIVSPGLGPVVKIMKGVFHIFFSDAPISTIFNLIVEIALFCMCGNGMCPNTSIVTKQIIIYNGAFNNLGRGKNNPSDSEICSSVYCI